MIFKHAFPVFFPSTMVWVLGYYISWLQSMPKVFIRQKGEVHGSTDTAYARDSQTVLSFRSEHHICPLSKDESLPNNGVTLLDFNRKHPIQYF